MKRSKTIEVDCRKCANCTGSACDKYGSDANKAVAKCAEDRFVNYKKTSEKTH